MAVAVFIRKASGFFLPSIEQKFVDKTTFGDTEIFNGPAGSSLNLMAVAVFIRKASGFFPQVLNRNVVDKNHFVVTLKFFNAQLVAALPDGCSSLHREGVGILSPKY